MYWLELKIPPPVVLVLIGIGMWFIAALGPSLHLMLPARIGVCVAIGLCAGLVAVMGEHEFRRAGTTVNPSKPHNVTALVTWGIYRYTRNPMYLGLLMTALAWAVFLDAAVAFAGPIAFVLYINRFQITPEERVLATRFGTAYGAYTARVRRWL